MPGNRGTKGPKEKYTRRKIRGRQALVWPLCAMMRHAGQSLENQSTKPGKKQEVEINDREAEPTAHGHGTQHRVDVGMDVDGDEQVGMRQRDGLAGQGWRGKHEGGSSLSLSLSWRSGRGVG